MYDDIMKWLISYWRGFTFTFQFNVIKQLQSFVSVNLVLTSTKDYNCIILIGPDQYTVFFRILSELVFLSYIYNKKNMSSERFACIEYNITNSSWHFGPNGPECHELFVKYDGLYIVNQYMTCRYISTFSTCALKLSIGNKKT